MLYFIRLKNWQKKEEEFLLPYSIDLGLFLEPYLLDGWYITYLRVMNA